MYNYDYYENVKEDVKEYILENYELDSSEDVQALDADLIQEECFISDSVTGNASGSYTFCRRKALDYVSDNTDLLEEAVNEGFLDVETVGRWFLESNYEAMDVTLRCYVLYAVVGDALDEIRAQMEDLER